MTHPEVRIEACRLAIAACGRDLSFDERIVEINALVIFFETMIMGANEPDEIDQQTDYPKIGDPI